MDRLRTALSALADGGTIGRLNIEMTSLPESTPLATGCLLEGRAAHLRLPLRSRLCCVRHLSQSVPRNPSRPTERQRAGGQESSALTSGGHFNSYILSDPTCSASSNERRCVPPHSAA